MGGILVSDGIEKSAVEKLKKMGHDIVEKFYTHSRVSLTPYIGVSTIEVQEKIGKEIVEIIKKQLN